MYLLTIQEFDGDTMTQVENSEWFNCENAWTAALNWYDRQNTDINSVDSFDRGEMFAYGKHSICDTLMTPYGNIKVREKTTKN